MVKKICSVVLAFLSVFIISNKLAEVVQGQANTDSAQIWRCLSATGDDSKRPPPVVDLNISASGFPSNQDIYVVVCEPDYSFHGTQPQNYKCTSGNPDADQALFGSDRTATIKPLTFEVPPGTSPPQPVQAAGDKVQAVIRLFNAKGHRSYAFFGVNMVEPRVIPGQASTLQYGTFEFQQDPKAVGGCKSIRWDPFGRVFDSQSLEPIRNVNVTLLDINKQFVSLPGLTNPEITEADGVYNFFVDIKGDPETFFLRPVKSTHTFTAEPNLHPNYSKAYYDIYKPEEPIVEAAGKPEHRDIPLDPGANPPVRSDPVSIRSAVVRLGRYIRYEGTLSHPLSIVTLVGKNSGEEFAKTEADKDGFWSILLPHENIPHSESLKLQIEKVDLTTLSKKPGTESFIGSVYKYFTKVLEKILTSAGVKVLAQTEGTDGDEFLPILSYIEGYAKDANGDILPNTNVNIKLQMTDSTYTQTTTDENGFFSIPPERLPIFSYYIEFINPNTSRPIKLTTEEFVQENEEHLAANNINLMAATKNGESLLPPLPASQESGTDTNTTPDQSSGQSLFAGSNMNLILTVIALIVLLGVAGGVLVYIKKKKSESDDLL